jgi:transcription termination factor NusB
LRKRRKSRELALQVLYHWDITGQDAAKTLIRFQEHFSPGPQRDEFAERIVHGVLEHCEDINKIIEQ